MSNCSIHFVPFETNCEQGFCDETRGSCVCYADYTNLGDLSFDPNGACDIHLPTLHGCWILVIVSLVVGLIFAIYFCLRRLVHGQMCKKRSAWKVDAIPVLAIVMSIISLPMAILKLQYPTTFLIGQNVAATLLAMLFCVLFTTCIFIGFVAFLELTLRLLPVSTEARTNLKGKLTWVPKLSIVVISVGTFFMCLGLILILPFPKFWYEFSVVFGVGLWVMMVVQGVFVGHAVLTQLIHTMNESNQSRVASDVNPEATKQMKLLVFKLQVGRWFVRLGFPLVSTILLAWLCFPYLAKKAGYLWPLGYFAGITAVGIMTWISSARPQKKTSAMKSNENNGRNTQGVGDEICISPGVTTEEPNSMHRPHLRTTMDEGS